MAAPSTTARVTPPGKKLEDGFKTVLAFARDPDVNLWEKSVKPPGIDGGEAIDQTTMFNLAWRTKAPRNLKDMTNATMTCAYDPNSYTQLLALVNAEGSITAHLPDGSTYDFWGYLKSFEPGDNTEGSQPEATCEIVPTNWDPVNRVEAGPVLTEVVGT